MARKKLWVYECIFGISVVAATTWEDATKIALSEVGTMGNVRDVHLATEEDLAWVRAMGGYVPAT